MLSSISQLLFGLQYQKIRFHGAVLLYSLVLILGSIPGAREKVGEFSSGLVLHATTYSVITLLLFSGISGSAWRKAILAFLIVAAMGAIDEFVQSVFPYRTASIMDWCIDFSAALLTALTLKVFWSTATQTYKPRLEAMSCNGNELRTSEVSRARDEPVKS